ncbi:MAG: nicotinamide-nucleotide amidase [Acidiferrobacterales bacterium]|nr:nicotinamide-nucleotide amidase [Acidiferrobacterales bacterium]
MSREIHRLAAEAGAALRDRKLKVATVESCTGGWIAQAMTDIAGSSTWFERGFVTYSNDAKQELVGVQAQTLAQHGAVSGEVAQQMAIGGIRSSRADVAVSVTGIAGPDGGSAEKPVGTVWIAWASRDGHSNAVRHRLQGNRRAVRESSVEQALQGLIRFLESHE